MSLLLESRLYSFMDSFAESHRFLGKEIARLSTAIERIAAIQEKEFDLAQSQRAIDHERGIVPPVDPILRHVLDNASPLIKPGGSAQSPTPPSPSRKPHHRKAPPRR